MPAKNDTIAVIYEDKSLKKLAEQLAVQLAIPITCDVESYDLVLAVTKTHLELRQNGKYSPGPVFVDFTSGALRYRKQFGGGRKEALAKAVGLKANRCPTVMDATAGLGRDAFILAGLGCTVVLVERSATVAALLEDGLKRALDDKETVETASRMQVIHANCRELKNLNPLPDVIYLDPMYPHRSKSALVKKEMRLIRAIVGNDEDADLLLDWALLHAALRVVVKRPQGAPSLGNRKPSLIINGNNSRFDVYFTNAAPGS